MGNDLDPLDEIFADETVKNARAVGKFQPRPKFRPARKTSAVPPVSSSKPVQTIDPVVTEVNKHVRNAKPSENSLDVEVGSDVDGGLHASTEKPAAENAGIIVELETFGYFHSTTNTEGAPPLSEEVVTSIPSSEDVGRPDLPGLASVDDPANSCKVDEVPACLELSADLDHVTAAEPNVSSSEGCDHMHGGESGKEDMDIIDSLNVPELTIKTEQRTGKFQPKRKKQIHDKIHEITESISPSHCLQSVPPEIDYAEKDSESTLQQDVILDLSDLGFTHTLPTEAASELPLNEELASGIDLNDVPGSPAKLASRRAKTGRSKRDDAPDPTPDQQRLFTSCEANEADRTLQPRKSETIVCELVDEFEEEVLAVAEFSAELTMAEENTIINECQVENASQTKTVKRKAKKSNDIDKPRKQRKKAEEAPKKDDVAKPKRFPRSTRRRRVNKALLEIPEDEIDYQKVPLRDLIILAEHREKHMKKEEAATGAPATKESNKGKSSSLYNEDGECNDDQENPEFEDNVFVNYHTHMDRTPRAKWSYQETELFYEAILQFGSDLSMIQQLFPERTRHQIKLKYKKEERQHPLRLREALTGRTNDHSHYISVIERLQKIAAEEKQNSGDEESIDLTINGLDEETPDADNGEAKDEHIEEVVNKADVDEFIEPQSSLKSDEDDDDDFFKWSQYKSDT